MTTLKAALQEAYFMELEEIPSKEKLSEDEALTFSAAFERKMKRLIRRADHPIRYRIAQIAACLLLAALLSGCTVLAVSPEARAAFVGWVRETYESWFVYRYIGESQSIPDDISYYPAWIPDGYYESSRFDTDAYAIIVYEDDDNNMITFYYAYDADATSLYLEQEDVNIKPVWIGDIYADLYVDEIKGNANSLVWVDEKSGVLFCISANCNEEELIKIAKSVEAQEAPKPQVIYRPTWIPDGYNELKQSISDDHVSIVYENDEGYLLSFTYTRNRESVNVYAEHQETDVQTVIVGDNAADLYWDQREGNTNTLIWSDEEKSAIFVISAHCSGDELIKIAESVEAVQ